MPEEEIWIKRVDDNLNFSEYVDWHSVRVEDNLTSQANILRFNVKKYGSITFTPAINDEIELYDYNTKIFAGNIVKIVKRTEGKKMIVFEVEVKDYTNLMDGKMVPDSWDDSSPETIIGDIVSRYLPAGFTTNNVAVTGVTFEHIFFNYIYPSKCIEELARLIGYDWYVDYDKDIHFFSKVTGEVAPFDITDTGEELWRDLWVKEDQKQLKNVIYVRGGEYVGASRTDKVGEGDGETKIFKLPYRYSSEPTITVGGAPQTVGIDFIDSEDDFNCLWGFQEKVIKFKTPPVAGDVEVTGTPYIPVLIKARSGASVNVYGEREYKVIDKNIISKETARDRAEGELLDYAETIKEGSFITYEDGLRSGMKITINSDDLGVNRAYIITRVVMKMLGPREPYYQVTMTTARTMGIIDYLQRQLSEMDKKIGPIRQEGEVIDVILDLEDIDTIDFLDQIKINDPKTILDILSIDTFRHPDTVLRAIIDSPPTWVVGSYAPVSDGDRKRPVFCDRDCLIVA